MLPIRATCGLLLFCRRLLCFYICLLLYIRPFVKNIKQNRAVVHIGSSGLPIKSSDRKVWTMAARKAGSRRGEQGAEEIAGIFRQWRPKPGNAPERRVFFQHDIFSRSDN
jgi:hypothetical protein